MEARSAQHEKTMLAVNSFLSSHRLPRTLEIRLRQYFQKLHLYEASGRFHQEFVMRKMSPELRGLCAKHTDDRWFSDLPFMAHLPNHLIADIFVAMRSQVFIPHELIFSASSLADNLYVVRHGVVSVGDKLLTEHKCFGEEAIFSTLGRRKYSARSMGFVETYVLRSTDFHDIMHDYPELLKLIRKDAVKLAFRRRSIQILAAMATRPPVSAPSTSSRQTSMVEPCLKLEPYEILFGGSRVTSDSERLKYLCQEVKSLRKLINTIDQ